MVKRAKDVDASSDSTPQPVLKRPHRLGSTQGIDHILRILTNLQNTPKLGARSKSGYILFSAVVRKKIMVDNPTCPFGKISRLVGIEWKKLSESDKKRFEEEAGKIAAAREKADRENGGKPFPSLPRLLRHMKEKHIPASSKAISAQNKSKHYFPAVLSNPATPQPCSTSPSLQISSGSNVQITGGHVMQFQTPPPTSFSQGMTSSSRMIMDNQSGGGVISAQPVLIYQVQQTVPNPMNSETEGDVTRVSSLRFADLGGLSVPKRILCDHVITPTTFIGRRQRYCEQRVIEPNNILTNWKTRSLLLYGPNGCGKTSLVEAMCTEAELRLIEFDWSENFENNHFLTNLSESDGKIEQSLIFFDDLDSSLINASKDTNQKLCKLVCSTIDFCHRNAHLLIFVVVAVVAHEKLENSLRRRFDVEIEVSAPNVLERCEILSNILTRSFCAQVSSNDVESIAERAHGFTPADLMTLCIEAGNRAENRKIQQQLGQQSSTAVVEKSQQTSASAIVSSSNTNELVHQMSANDDGKIRVEDLRSAMVTVRPSTMREIFVEVPKVYWSDIGGQERLKLQLRQAIEWPLKHAEAFARLGIRPPSGVLMYGPPGCSKTMVAKAIATESGLNFLAVNGPELFSKWVGESERAVRDIFKRARQVAPSIVFFDEIDALAAERSGGSGNSGGSNVADRVLTQLLTEMDGVQALDSVLVVAATNRPDVIDKALLRPGRLDRVVYVPLPDPETRRAIFQIQFRKTPVNSDVSIDQLTSLTTGYSGAELVAVCREAALLAMEESIESRDVARRHFEQALKNSVKPRTDANRLVFYENFSKSCC